MKFHSDKKKKIKVKKILIIILGLFLSVTISIGQDEYFPEKPHAWVNDYADMLDEQEENYLNRKLAAYEDSTSTQIFVVSMNNHGNVPVDLMGAQIGESWMVGQGTKDNGMIILIYPGARRISIQTGYGVEQYVPDALARRIIENEINPNFKNGEYLKGLDNATNVLFGLLSGQFTGDEYRKQTQSAGNAPIGILIFVILFFIISRQTRSRRSRTMGSNVPLWIALSMLGGSRHSHHGSYNNFSSGSGSFGGFGGFSGGGGGSFGGGGASGGW